MKHAGCNEESMRNWGLLLLRIAVGVVFIYHGWGKLHGIEQTAGFFGNIGIPAAGFMAWVVALVEFLGGIAVLLGLFTRLAAKLLAIVMLVALFTAHWGGPWKSAELPIALLGGLCALMTIGGGKWQVLRKWDCLPWCNMCPKPERK